MKPGMFGRDGKIELQVDEDGTVINGAWTVEYDEYNDQVRCPAKGKYPPSPWAQRVCDTDPAISYRDYNKSILAHQEKLDGEKTP